MRKRCGLLHHPNHHVTVEGHIVEFELVLIAVVVSKCGIKVAFIVETETVNFNLLGEVNPVL